MWDGVFGEFRRGFASSEAEIARAEAELGFRLPDSYRSFCEAWVSFFRSLLALTPPAWKRLIAGVPWTTLEYRYADDKLSVSCSCPADSIHLVTTALAAALPGADVHLEKEGTLTLLGPFTARARLRLWREPLHAIGEVRLGDTDSVIAAMAIASESVLQIAIAHDPAWESKAQRRLDRLSGYGPRRSFVLDVLLHVGFNAAQDARLVSWSAHVPTLPAAIGAQPA